MRVSLGQTQSQGPVVGCLQNTPEGMYYIPTSGDSSNYYNPNAPLCYSDMTAAPATPAVTPAEPPPALPNLPTLTPLNITQPLPSITSTLSPAQFPSTNLWCAANVWIEENPILSAAILAGLVFIAWPKKGVR